MPRLPSGMNSWPKVSSSCRIEAIFRLVRHFEIYAICSPERSEPAHGAKPPDSEKGSADSEKLESLTHTYMSALPPPLPLQPQQLAFKHNSATIDHGTYVLLRPRS
uniref:Uncharacterized protein n=1 Tax=Loa loa TaxID=7209 RepID=A0A1I7VXD9_LOALO